ncbi:transcriptional repressor CTCF-like [Uranotaenia lowii]|uniref:transcriptional repressor CTCF-like n=1 Tax=Uranotaenia lowii TaxID=190385 RepID=UPI00247933D7|nr:transcriptional repressor CTCF-like [Uranotaenia lowii]
MLVFRLSVFVFFGLQRMETRKKRFTLLDPNMPEPLFEEVVVKLEPEDCDSLVPESDEEPIRRKKKRLKPASKNRNRQRMSRQVQVNMEDLDRHLDKDKSKGAWELDRDDEPIFLPDNVVIDSQCRFCLRKLDKSHLNVIERSLKAKMRLVFKIRIHPYDSYPFVCTNCTNLIHMLVDFREALVKSKILLKQEKTELEEGNWVAPEHLAAAALCREIVDQHRKRVEEIYNAYQQRLKDAEELEQGKLKEIAQAHSVVKKLEIAVDFAVEEPTDTSSSVLVKQDDTSQEKEGNTDNWFAVKEENSDSSDADNVQNFDDDDSEDEDYKPTDSKQDVMTKSPDESDESDSDAKLIDIPVVRKRGRPKKGTAPAPKLPKEKQERKPRKPRESKPKGEPQDNCATHSLCPICGKSIHITSKEAHMNQHSGVQPYKCPFEGCNLTFYGKYHRSRHIKRMHSNNGGARTNECDICGKTIRGSLAVLKQHQLRHAVTDKNIVCNVCGQAFWMLKYLKKHMIIHTDLFPYECQYCGKKFKHKASKDTHEKNVHEKKNNFGAAVRDFSGTEYNQQMDLQCSGFELNAECKGPVVASSIEFKPSEPPMV